MCCLIFTASNIETHIALVGVWGLLMIKLKGTLFPVLTQPQY